MSRSRADMSSNIAGVGKYGLQGMQKSTGPVPSPPCRVNAAIDGLCAALLRNSEVTLSAMEPPYGAGPAGTDRARRVWVARAGEHGPPLDTGAGVALFNACERGVTSGTKAPLPASGCRTAPPKGPRAAVDVRLR